MRSLAAAAFMAASLVLAGCAHAPTAPVSAPAVGDPAFHAALAAFFERVQTREGFSDVSFVAARGFPDFCRQTTAWRERARDTARMLENVTIAGGDDRIVQGLVEACGARLYVDVRSGARRFILVINDVSRRRKAVSPAHQTPAGALTIISLPGTRWAESFGRRARAAAEAQRHMER